MIYHIFDGARASGSIVIKGATVNTKLTTAVSEEFVTAELGDERLSRRLQMMTEAAELRPAQRCRREQARSPPLKGHIVFSQTRRL
jgi:hypothetical protein